jgi:Leucine rich repeat
MQENGDRIGSSNRDVHVDEPEDNSDSGGDDNGSTNNTDSGDDENSADNESNRDDGMISDEEPEGGDGTGAEVQTAASSGPEDDGEISNHSAPFAYPAPDDNGEGGINDEEPLLANNADDEEDVPSQPKNEAADPMIQPLIIFIALAILLSVIVFPILFLVVLPNSIETTGTNNNPEPPKDITSTQVPTEDPTSNPVDWSVLQLPANITTIIEEDDMSSAAQAYRWLLQDPNIEDYTPARREQRFSLVGLYYATGGENWVPKAQTSWLDYDTDECQWGGVSCASAASNATNMTSNIFSSRHGHNLRRQLQAPSASGPAQPGDASLSLAALNFVQGLSLSTAGLRAVLPPELFLLTGLRSLNVSGNELVGPLSRAFGQLTQLQALDVSNNAMSGIIPVELEASSMLRQLDLSDNRGFTGVIPSGLCTMESLIFACLPDTAILRLCGCDCACVGNETEIVAVGSNASSTTMAPATQANTTTAPTFAYNTSGTTGASSVATNETSTDAINATEMVVISTGVPSNQTGVVATTTAPSSSNTTNGNTTAIGNVTTAV